MGPMDPDDYEDMMDELEDRKEALMARLSGRPNGWTDGNAGADGWADGDARSHAWTDGRYGPAHGNDDANAWR